MSRSPSSSMITHEPSPLIVYFTTSYESLVWPFVKYLWKREKIQGYAYSKERRQVSRDDMNSIEFWIRSSEFKFQFYNFWNTYCVYSVTVLLNQNLILLKRIIPKECATLQIVI